MVKEYKVFVGDDEQIVMVDSEGEPVDRRIGERLGLRLADHYESKTQTIYFAQSIHDKDLFKIGITGDTDRREREIECKILHYVYVSSTRVRRIEKILHQIYAQWSVGHEMFRFGEEAGIKAINILKEHARTEYALMRMMERAPREGRDPVPWQWLHPYGNLKKEWWHYPYPTKRLPGWLTGEPEKPFPSFEEFMKLREERKQNP